MTNEPRPMPSEPRANWSIRDIVVGTLVVVAIALGFGLLYTNRIALR